MNKADMFRKVFGIYATELWVMSEHDFLEWLNSEYKKKGEEKQTMDDKAIKIVVDYVWSHLDKTDDHPDTFATFIVWKCKILQNWKWLISTNLPDGMYYEVTYNGDKKEFYLDAYKKFENRCIWDREDR